MNPLNPLPALEAIRDLSAEQQAEGHRIALLVVHGMGQQIKFQTLNDVVYGLRGAAARDGWTFAAHATRLLRHRTPEKCEYLPRAEVTLEKQGRSIEVHIYESYWAPLPEGKVTLRDVASFLFTAGINGARLAYNNFARIIEGRWRDLEVRPATGLYFVIALCFVLALFILNTALGIVTAASVLPGVSSSGWPSERLVRMLVIDFASFEGIVLLFAASALLANMHWARFRAANATRRGTRWALRGTKLLLKALAWGAVLGTIAVAGALLLQFAWFNEPTPGQRLRLGFWRLAVIGGAMIASWGARWFLVQYLGDVVVYVSAHSVNRFSEIRSAIQETAVRVGRAVYSQAQYARVVLVGHSLGSVIAYDVFNALVNEGASAGTAMKTDLVTFGSPLDKTAFVFRSQKIANADYRESLATGVQAILVARANHPRSWTNVWSADDWISGELNYYGGPITNLEDPEACIPLVAHVQYWQNAIVFDTVLQRLS